MTNEQNSKRSFTDALKYSFPVLLGYLAIGFAFGLLLVDAGYPWWLALVMSLVMYAGAGQYIAVGLFAAGAGLWEAVLVQLVVNARHMAYGLTMLKRFNAAGLYKYYLIFGLSDETFALLSSLEEEQDAEARKIQSRFMFMVALLDQAYWVAGSVIGAVAGALIPFNMEGIGFALTAMFVVLMTEQILRVKRPGPFIISALAALLGVAFLPSRLSLLTALVIALGTTQLLTGNQSRAGQKEDGNG
ncbi:branched-chain amino acid transport protein AzlC [Treponema primitia ZAS-2]|uniref:Branched-chain amino acid transport protein AzlC n=1 Tax=Treponema primitia (strain ATCC BAA-887 / DSM 12427 / ZAS-2) TaxID=545694 RepID=F5YJ97_TREPZ|nr:AzlC family ABC transporter permease [Treponema primitia]AEF83605.1 branched-chain amino acid transport protein AzlC [Treponema primitia ZAS-2]